jgi:hypothetical protein
MDYPGSQSLWLVQCDFCGVFKGVRGDDVMQGHRLRCNCYNADSARRATRPAAEIAAELAAAGVRMFVAPRWRRDGTDLPGRGQCISCGDEITVRMVTVRKGLAKGCACDPRRLMPRDGTCGERGCGEPVRARGLCVLHYGRAHSEALSDRECDVDGCLNSVLAAGLRASHYTKGRNHIIGEHYGYNPAAEAALYLTRDGESFKYGKCQLDRLEARLRQHRWHTEVVDVWTGLGADVTFLERVIRSHLRHLARYRERRDGYRETHYRVDLDPSSLTELVSGAGTALGNTHRK